MPVSAIAARRGLGVLRNWEAWIEDRSQDQATRPEPVDEYDDPPSPPGTGETEGDPVDRALIEQEIARLLVEMGVRVERLCPTARLLQDLRIEGDDAAEFFEAVAARFGTDLTLLREDWSAYFGPEGLSVTAVAAVAIGSVLAATAAALAGLPALLCVVPAAMGGTAAWLLGRSTGTGQLRPIRLGEVADAVERGCWNGMAGTGRRERG